MSLEGLKQEVAEKLSRVENTLAKVEGVHRDLQDNAREVEQKIHEAADRQVEALRVRERQLVRQVQVVTHLESEGLRSQQAGLMHKKGALAATQDILSRCSCDDTNTLAKITVENIDMQGDIQSMGEVMVQFDEVPLSSAITKFGSVQLPERITHHTSPVIPTSVEEYEDEEHDVLHKSVASTVCVPGAPVHVTVQFPRLANHTWLARNQPANAITAKRTLAKGGVVATGALNKTDDIASWLTGLQLSAGHHEEADGFDMLSDKTPGSAAGSSSIEIVPSHFGSEKDYSPSSGYEIENLHMYIGEKSRWLNTKPSNDKANLEQQLQVSSVCQANEVCQSFSDCVCQNKCKETALEKIQQGAEYRAKVGRKRTYSEAEGVDSVIDHMVKIRASENSGWLVKTHNGLSHLPVPVKRVIYQSPVDNWLKLTGCPSFTSAPNRVHNLSVHSNIWLLRNLKSQQKTKEAREKGDSEKENDKDEKENKITTEALTEALKKVTVSNSNDTNAGWVLETPSRNSLDFTASNNSSTTASNNSSTTASNNSSTTASNNSSTTPNRVTFIKSEQPWLLSENLGNGRHSRDNRLEEKDAANKKQWLIYSTKSSQLQKVFGTNDDLARKKLEAMASSNLPETVLSVAQAGIKNWLMKNFA